MAGRGDTHTGRFIMSAPTFTLLPQHDGVEVAFAGRSNVGKSSLLGQLLRAQGLVRTSRTPGRTQLLNFFAFGDAWAAVDLPGYGFAKLGKVKRLELGQMIRDYIAKRSLLRGVVVVLDARRTEGSALDRDMVAWAMTHGRRVLLAVTKMDLIGKNRQLHHARLLEKAMQVPAGSSVVCSSRSGAGVAELRRRVWELQA